MRKVYLLLIVLVAAVMLGAVPLAAQDTVHVVQPGENLFRIAQDYATDVNTLVQLNSITNSWQIYAGQVLVIPAGSAGTTLPDPIVTALELPAVTQTHVVNYGEHLSSIANLYGMSPEQLAAMNGITNPNLIYVGQVLTVSGAAPAPAEPVPAIMPTAVTLQNAFDIPQPAATGEVRHIVLPGEYLSEIANQYGVSWLSIAQANGIYDPNTIYAGLELIIPGATTGYAAGFVEVPPAPAAYIGSGREIIVDLSDQRTYAYENGVLIRNVLVSTGLPATPTVQGDFTVERKYGAQTMAGPGYYLPDVPYVMYFYSGYALHGTYWHSNFGQPMSHGCVNLPTPDAEWFYSWADYGTPVHVQA